MEDKGSLAREVGCEIAQQAAGASLHNTTNSDDSVASSRETLKGWRLVGVHFRRVMIRFSPILTRYVINSSLQSSLWSPPRSGRDIHHCYRVCVNQQILW